MSVITFSREMGSEGRQIAVQTALTLGYHFVDKEKIEQIFLAYGFVDFKEEYNTPVGFWGRFDTHRTEMVAFLNRVIVAVVAHGNVVLLGRGGFAMLKGDAGILNVRVQAPFDLRVQRVMAQQQIAEVGRAQEIVKESDRLRRDFVESLSKMRWDAASAFDVVVDTGKVPPDRAISWLVELGAAMDQVRIGRPPVDYGVDSVLAHVVNDVLECQLTHLP